MVNASNIDKDWNWVTQYNTKNVSMKNVSDNYSLFAVQGLAVEALQSLASVNLSEIPFYHFVVSPFGSDFVIISATGYTGAADSRFIYTMTMQRRFGMPFLKQELTLTSDRSV